jgi:uncharacterized protein YjbI with pentapeptide repeats
MAATPNQPEEDFAEAENKFELKKLKTDLEAEKGGKITSTVWKYLKGVLCEYELKEIAEKCVVGRKTVEVYLNKNIKYELLKLLQLPENTRIDWSRVPNLLAKAGYKIQAIEERFLQATNQLSRGDKSRIKIVALEGIANEYPSYHGRIMKVLSDFVRENCLLKEEEEGQKEKKKCLTKIPNDIQAALNLLGQLDPKKYPENHKLDLSNTNLEGADLRKANFQGAVLRNANLQRANLIEVNLQGADLWGANLQGAKIIAANLEEAELGQANLEGAFIHMAHLENTKLRDTNLRWSKLEGANLKGAVLTDADLQCADLRKANLEAAQLTGAKLRGANLSHANLKEADLRGADLKTTNLSEANIESQQIKSAYGNSTTVLPDNVKAPQHWMQAG